MVIAIALFSEVLRNFPAQRCAELKAKVPGGIECVYALVWPDYVNIGSNAPGDNRVVFNAWRQQAGVKVWAWLNAHQNQEADAAAIASLNQSLNPDGWLLDIEGTWTKGANLGVLFYAAKKTGKPVRASFAAMTAAHVEYDYRGADQRDIAIDWQAYFDSGEGSDPKTAVTELYACSFVLEGWQYRHKLGTVYGWGKVGAPIPGMRMNYDSYKLAAGIDLHFAVALREWGHAMTANRGLFRNGLRRGTLLGRAKYKNIRVTLDVTRGAQDKHTLAEWTTIAASARYPGLARRPVSVYLAEIARDDVLIAIAKGAP